jgi:protocatechuate 3,4-dioxygenase alpha subunit
MTVPQPHTPAAPAPSTAGSTAPSTAPSGPTPSQTVGPFYGYALPVPGDGDMAPAGHPGTITVHGRVYDGAGAPVPDALLELWQADRDGDLTGAPGSLRRDPVTGGHLGRNGVDFTGFARVQTDADGHWSVRTLMPGASPSRPPYVSVCVFARGLLHHLYTRLYFPEHAETHAADPLLASLDPARRETLVATAEQPAGGGQAAAGAGTYRFDIRMQGERETVFLDFR